MEIKDLLKTEVMILDLQATSKEAVIDEMVNKLVSEGYVNDFATFKAGIMAREAQNQLQPDLAMELQCLTVKIQRSMSQSFSLQNQKLVLTTPH